MSIEQRHPSPAHALAERWLEFAPFTRARTQLHFTHRRFSRCTHHPRTHRQNDKPRPCGQEASTFTRVCRTFSSLRRVRSSHHHPRTYGQDACWNSSEPFTRVCTGITLQVQQKKARAATWRLLAALSQFRLEGEPQAALVSSCQRSIAAAQEVPLAVKTSAEPSPAHTWNIRMRSWPALHPRTHGTHNFQPLPHPLQLPSPAHNTLKLLHSPTLRPRSRSRSPCRSVYCPDRSTATNGRESFSAAAVPQSCRTAT